MTYSTEPTLDKDRVLDVREIPCSIKHGLVLRTCLELPQGSCFILLNGHDPVPISQQLQTEFPGCYAWDYLERGPEAFRIRISKLRELPEGAGANLSGECPRH